MKTYTIYQLPIEHKAKYMDLEFVREHNVMPQLSDYNKVYTLQTQDEKSLDDIYRIFNVAHPADFTGHSLSVSDVVEIDGKYYYCDSYGWEEITFPTNAEVRSIDDALTPEQKKYMELKAKYPEAILLFRCGDFYVAYQDDAKHCAKTLGITLTQNSKSGVYIASFPHHALDVYLPKLVRSGVRIAIVDPMEAPKQPTRRRITERVY